MLYAFKKSDAKENDRRPAVQLVSECRLCLCPALKAEAPASGNGQCSSQHAEL